MRRTLVLAAFAASVWIGTPVYAAPAKRVRALTFNIRFDFPNDGQNRWKNRLDAVVKRIQQSKAHVVCLQEDKKHQVEDLQAKLKDYAFLGRGRNATGSGERCSILYLKKAFKLKGSGSFWLSDTPDKPGSNTFGDKYPRVVTWAMLEHKRAKRSLLVLNTHFPEGNRERIREQGAEVIAKWLGEKLGTSVKGASKRSVRASSKRRSRRGRSLRGSARKRSKTSKSSKVAILLTGDFNTDAGTRPHELLTQAPFGLKDAWLAARPADAHPGTYAGWRGMKTRQRIDWLLVGGKTRVVRAGKLDTQVDGRWPSDHYAVWAEFDLR